MRRTALTCLGFASLAIAPALIGASGCSTQAPSEHVIRAMEPIQGGTLDTTDTAVVGILINSSQGMSLCSGSLIGPNLVLSAHHCVADSLTTSCTNSGFGTTYSASSFRVTTSYNAAAAIFNSGGSLPAADGVTWWAVNKVSVPGNNICGQDMSVLQLSSPINGVCPLIPAVDVPVTQGESYKAVGFGITSPNGQTAGTRYQVSGMSVTCASNCAGDSPTEEWEGGATSNKGTCEGDSGGPSLDSSGRVLGTVSRGPAGACNSTVYESVYGEAAWIKQMASAAATAGGYTAAGWVTGASTSSPTSGYCGGSSSSSSSSGSASSSSSSSGSTGGGCPSGLSCIDGSGQGDYGCFDPNTSTGFPNNAPTCTSATSCATGYSCWAASQNAMTGSCIQDCTPGSSSSSSSGTTSSGTTSSSSSGGTNQCSGAMPTGTPACDTCIDNSCCNELVACSNDQTCVSCAGSASPPSSCNSNANYTGFLNCVSTTCLSSCSSSSSSSSSGSASSSSGGASSSSGGASSSSGGASSSSGIFGGGGQGTGGSAGTGNSGTGAGHFGGLGNTPGASSGCSVASTGDSDPSAPLSFAGLLFGAAMMVSRRRR